MTAVVDLECDNVDPKQASLKFFGGYDIENKKLEIYSYKEREKIESFLNNHKIIIGFNFKNYDKIVLQNYGVDMKYKIIIDLYESLAPRGDNGFGINNKDRLHDINPSLVLKNYKLKTIVNKLKIDEVGKGDIDYDIFKKDEWNDEEIEEIKKYLKQDLKITHKLFVWYKSIFKPLEPYLDELTKKKLKHLTCTSGVLSYKVLCYLNNMKEDYNSKEEARELKFKNPRIEGGHHIHAKWEKVRGKIVCKDFVSHYPTTIIMYNLLNKKLVNSIHKILKERLKAKKEKNKSLSLALKIPLNSFYGICGNPTFKNIYNPKSAKECTKIGRRLLKRYAKTLDIAGFIPLYGFTDSVYTGIPKNYAEEDLDLITHFFINEEKNKSPNPIDSFNLETDGIYKFIWFIEKKDNNYLYITEDNKIKIKGGLFDINCPKAIKELFDNYISKKIIKELDVNFTKLELRLELEKILNKNPELSAEYYSVKDLKQYNSKTSLQFQISEKYGPGKHWLIPLKEEIENIGVGKKLKYCSLEDFNKNKLEIKDISFDRMMRYIKVFYETKEDVLEI